MSQDGHANANDDAQLASSLMFFAATMKDRDIAACMEKAAARISHVVSETLHRSTVRREVLGEIHQKLHDMKNLQRASAWPHVEGVARAEKMVWDLICEASK